MEAPDTTLSLAMPQPEPEPQVPVRSASPVASAGGLDPALDEPGHGAKIASIAMRNWIYLQPTSRSTKIGYLRAGAVVERAQRPAGHDGCEGGWYRVAPRGYVCVGKGASLDLNHPIVQVAARGPRRGEPLPYQYVLSLKPPPHLYFQLPTEQEQDRAEGRIRLASILRFAQTQLDELGPPDPLPLFLKEGNPLPKPYGAERPLHYLVHRGRARPDSAFGLISTFEWTGRRLGLTTELDLIPLDRTQLAIRSEMTGVEVEGEGTPALVFGHGVETHRMDEHGTLRRVGTAEHRSGWVLTGRNNGSPAGMVETTSGLWLPAGGLRIPKPREDRAGFSEEDRKWIDVSLEDQLLVAYQGKKPVFATLISSGRGKVGDPETSHATIRGTFLIHAKHVSGTMDGDEDTTESSFDLRDVPYIQYFHKGYALHGAYWHDKFGEDRSHGCINLAPADAAWLFEWTEPKVPQGWHGALNPNAGTLIYIHR